MQRCKQLVFMKCSGAEMSLSYKKQKFHSNNVNYLITKQHTHTFVHAHTHMHRIASG